MWVNALLDVRRFSWSLLLVFAGVSTAQAATQAELVAAGKRLYLDGIGVSGKPIRAIVQGDVPIDGTQATCQSCHGRSGMGSIESGMIPPGITGPLLFAPDIRTRTQRQRPAYTAKSLAVAIRAGVDASGKLLDPLMPRFKLGQQDIKALTVYLRQLGANLSPGSTETTLHLATVVSDQVDPKLAQAELDVIQTFIAARNRGGPQRLRGGHFPHDIKETYRKWSHAVWRVSGPPATWRAQLDKYYRQRPAFALIGGLAVGSWQPINDFCEQNAIPCILPDTDLPPEKITGFYSYYYSRGMRLEADVLAATLHTRKRDSQVLSIVDQQDPRALAAADAFAAAVKHRGGQVQTQSQADHVQAEKTRASAIVLWLTPASLKQVDGLPAGTPVFVSATLMGNQASAISAALRARAWRIQLTAPARAPDPALRRFHAWAYVHHMKITDLRHQALAYFACMAFAEGVKHTGLYLSRDYLLDLLNHSAKLNPYIPLYTKGGVTPWQRVLSRGGYLVDLGGHTPPTWVVP